MCENGDESTFNNISNKKGRKETFYIALHNEIQSIINNDNLLTLEGKYFIEMQKNYILWDPKRFNSGWKLI